MVTPKVLYRHLPNNSIDISISTASSRIIDNDLEKQVDNLWREQEAKCIARGENKTFIHWMKHTGEGAHLLRHLSLQRMGSTSLEKEI